MELRFELRDAIRNNLTTQDIEGVKKVVFHMTVVVGVVGNTYDGFLNSSNAIDVVCDQSLTGDEMDLLIKQSCLQFVQNTYPPIIIPE